ncbi:MAG TPA: FlgD immunoglobulin-like domain containing protein, partial [Candidatus Eisenbacteria bacterium]|nr:FlgD immunoglobulin-like domain containing protein [Candidatus Eisenbacteria bacterium]
SVLYPFADGFLDTVTIRASSNLAAAGTVRILSSSGGIVRQWSLPAATASAVTWNGTTASGARVAAGSYTAQVLLVGRTGAQAQVALLPLTVRTSQVGVPSVSVSSATVYPVRDGFRDTMTITSRTQVPATFTYQVVKNGRILWSKAFTRRTTATWAWGGVNRSGVRLPDGSYTLKVIARGGEGTATVRTRTVSVSSLRAVPTTFSTTVAASDVARYGAGNPRDPYGIDNSVFFPADSVVTFTRKLPTTVKGWSNVRITACGARVGTATPQPVLGYFSGTALTPDFYPYNRALASSSGCATTPTGPPPAAMSGGTLRWYVANLRTTASTWRLDSVRISGTRYVLTR